MNIRFKTAILAMVVIFYSRVLSGSQIVDPGKLQDPTQYRFIKGIVCQVSIRSTDSINHLSMYTLFNINSLIVYGKIFYLFTY